MQGIYQRLKRLFRFIFVRADYESLEFVNSLILLVVAIAFVNPYVDFFVTGRTFSIVSSFLSEAVFGSILLFIAVNGIVALADGDLKYRLFTTASQTFIWLSLYVLFLSANRSSLVGLLPVVFSLSCGITVARVWRDILTKRSAWWTLS